MFTFCFATMFLFNNGICTILNSDMLSSMFLFSDLPTQLASELVCLQLVSQACRRHMFSPMSTQLVLCKARKHLGHIITGKLKRLLWPPGFSQLRIRASKIFRPPVPWCKFSAQQDCIGRRNAARHQAPPSVTPVWKLLEPKETVSTKWATFGGQIIKVF